MTNSEILAVAFELKEEILNSELYKELKEKEEKMMNDKECFELLNLFQEAQNKYNEAKRFEKYGSNVEEAQKHLYDIKLLVDNNPFVKAYNEAYKKLYKEIKNIEKVVFDGIVKPKKEILIEE